MAQPVPAPQPNAQSQPVPSQSTAKLSPSQSVLALPKRSPEIQAEVERIRDSETYKDVSRDQLLFKWLSSQQESRASGFVYGVNFGDLRKSCQFYQLLYVRKRGNLFLTPTSVLYTEVEQFGSPTDLSEAKPNPTFLINTPELVSRGISAQNARQKCYRSDRSFGTRFRQI